MSRLGFSPFLGARVVLHVGQTFFAIGILDKHSSHRNHPPNKQNSSEK